MSGPLATWVGEHSKASWKGRAVLKEYALAAHHDGTPAADVTLEDLEVRTALGRTTIKAGRREVVVELGELVELERPGKGRGYPGRYRVPFTLCPPEAGCWCCPILADLLAERGRVTTPSDPGKGRGKGSRERRKGSRHGRKGSRHDPTTETGNGSPTQGGTVTHPESAEPAPSQSSGSAEPGNNQPASHEAWQPLPAEIKAAWRQVLDVDKRGLAAQLTAPQRPRLATAAKNGDKP